MFPNYAYLLGTIDLKNGHITDCEKYVIGFHRKK